MDHQTEDQMLYSKSRRSHTRETFTMRFEGGDLSDAERRYVMPGVAQRHPDAEIQ
jgi:hypothetical protein